MLNILINNRRLWLAPETKLRYEIMMPFLQQNVIPEAVITWFDVPAVQPNIDIYNYSHYYEINRTTRAYDCVVEFGGLRILAGKHIVKNVSNTRYRSCCVSNAFQIGFGDMLLPDVVDEENVLGTTSQDVVDHANACVALEYPDAKWQFPRIQNEKLYGETSEYNLDYPPIYALNYWFGTFFKNSIHQDPDPDNVYCLIPMPYLVGVISKIFEYAKYSVFGSFMTHAEIKKLIIYNNYPLDLKERKYYSLALSSLQLVQFYSGWTIVKYSDTTTPPAEDNDNCFDNILHYYTIKNKGYYYIKTIIRTGDFNEAIPNSVICVYNDITLVTSSPGINLYENGTYSEEFTFYADDSNINNTIQHIVETATGNFYINYSKIIIQNVSCDNLNIYKKSINLKNHVPKKTIGEFLNINKDCFGISAFIDSDKREVQFELVKDIIESQEYLDITDNVIIDPSSDTDIELQDKTGYKIGLDFGSTDALVENNFRKYGSYNYLGEYDTNDDLPVSSNINDIALIKTTNVLYIWKVDPVTNISAWNEYADNFFDVETGDAKTEIRPSVSTLFNRFMSLINMLYRPEISQVGNSAAFDTGENDFDYKLLLYHGLRADKVSDTYPLASHTAYDYMGNKVADLEMRMDGELGIYEKLLKPMYDFLDGAERITARLDIDLEMLYNILQLFKPQHNGCKRKLMNKSIKHIPEKFTFIMGVNDKIEECEVIMLKPAGQEI